MSESSQRNNPSGGSGDKSLGKRGGGDPGTRGRTTIADGVVEKIAGMAARDVVGVHAMGSGLSRTFGAVRDRSPAAASPSPAV